MADLHPFFVHFPIALLTVAVLFDIYAWLRSSPDHFIVAFSLQVLSGLSAMLAAFSGNSAETTVRDNTELLMQVGPALDNHVSWGNTMVWIIIFFVLGRTFALLEKKNWATAGAVFPLLSIVLAILILITGFLGGDLSASILDAYRLNS